jgi:hypothetical protein
MERGDHGSGFLPLLTYTANEALSKRMIVAKGSNTVL